MTLKKYQSKRNFNKSPEPPVQFENSDLDYPIFVIQKHAARKLHYDFRLEFNGILLSWAVPKGPSLNPNEKHLAIQVEDHPYEYKDFEGSIPKGNYGAGTVSIWDSGIYTTHGATDRKSIEKNMRKGLKNGVLDLILFGDKLRGGYSLFKIGKKDPENNTWLLVKKKDEYANRNPHGKHSTSVFPQNISPMLATVTDTAFDDPDWIFEIKWDGYRAITQIHNTQIQLLSRNQLLLNDTFPEILQDLQFYKSMNLIFDGEIVSLNEEGKPQFQWLHQYRTKPQGTLVYYIFDLLYYDEQDLRDLPLIQRKALLEKLIVNTEHIRYCDHVAENGVDFFKLIQKNGLEGVIAKEAHSKYLSGKRSKKWLKIKSDQHLEAIIVGFTKSREHRQFGSFVLGVYKDNELTYIGHSGGGFSESQLSKLYQRLTPLILEKSAFPEPPTLKDPTIWVKPILACEVKFSGWTEKGIMRHPIFVALKTANSTKSPVKFTHLDKVYFPQMGFTKKDILDYYESMSQTILPYLYNKPQSLYRFPDGIEQEGFFQKDIDFKVPNFVERFSIYSKSNNKEMHYLLCNNQETLLYMVNLGCIDLNPWLSSIEHLQYPDFAVLDLDPLDIDFTEVIKTARVVYKLMKDLSLKGFCKTSGKRGLHIYFPLQAKYPYSVAKEFIHLLASLVLTELPKITSLERNPKKRQHKIYLDYLQNRKGQTIASPYCVRPTAEATVSTPVSWEEVNKSLSPTQFTIKNIPDRVQQIGDIFADVLTASNDIEMIIQKIENQSGIPAKSRNSFP